MRCQWFICLILLFSGAVFAQEKDITPNDFIGLIQYLDGNPIWVNRVGFDSKERIGFKTFFHRGDKIQLSSKNDYLKIVTARRCIGVTYGNVILVAPQQVQNAFWTVEKEGSVRWICPEGSTELLKVFGANLKLQGAEILFHEGKILVLKGRVLSRSGELVAGILYERIQKKWRPVSGQNSYMVWELDQQVKKPLESFTLKKTPQPIVSRWYLGPLGGGASVKHNNDAISEEDFQIFGVRLANHRQHGKKSIMYVLSYYETETSNDKEPGSGGPAVGEVYNFTRSDILSFEIGSRIWHENFWSPYYRLGLAYEYFEADIFGFGFNTNRSQEYLDLTGAVGVEAMFLTKWLGWGGLFASVELFGHQAVLELGSTVNNENYSSGSGKPSEISGFPSLITRVGLNFNLGFVLQF